MSIYSASITKLKNSINNLKAKQSSLSNIDFDTSWSGKAHDKQMEHRTNLLDVLQNSINDLNTLVEVLNEIDTYNTIRDQKDKWQSTYNSIPSDEKDKKSNAYNQLESARRLENEKKNYINSLLNKITTSYDIQINAIDKTEVLSTNDTFATIYNSSNNVGSTLEISQYVKYNYNESPNFNNTDAWVTKNPYSQSGLYGQCTWFAWGKFYEMYGYDPGFRGNGKDCAYQLASAHPDSFEISKYPTTGSVFSYQGYPYGHVGIITEVKDGMLTYQDGNYDGVTNSFAVAQRDWGTKTIPVEQFINRYGGKVVFANPTSNTVTV